MPFPVFFSIPSTSSQPAGLLNSPNTKMINGNMLEAFPYPFVQVSLKMQPRNNWLNCRARCKRWGPLKLGRLIAKGGSTFWTPWFIHKLILLIHILCRHFELHSNQQGFWLLAHVNSGQKDLTFSILCRYRVPEIEICPRRSQLNVSGEGLSIHPVSQSAASPTFSKASLGARRARDYDYEVFTQHESLWSLRPWPPSHLPISPGVGWRRRVCALVWTLVCIHMPLLIQFKTWDSEWLLFQLPTALGTSRLSTCFQPAWLRALLLASDRCVMSLEVLPQRK